MIIVLQIQHDRNLILSTLIFHVQHIFIISNSIVKNIFQTRLRQSLIFFLKTTEKHLILSILFSIILHIFLWKTNIHIAMLEWLFNNWKYFLHTLQHLYLLPVQSAQFKKHDTFQLITQNKTMINKQKAIKWLHSW